MTYYLISDSGVQPVEGNVTITARQAVSCGNLVVDINGKPVEPPIGRRSIVATDDEWYGRFPRA